MDVSSVSSSINAALAVSLQSPARTRAAEQDQQAQQAQQAQQPTQAQSTQQAQGTAPADERQTQQAVTEAEKNRPTVNINGQTVGTLVNTTA